jgi:RNA polymerase sigma-70 factor (ECF subfamily)
MDEQDRYVALVQRVQQGDQTALGELADLARERLAVYVYRLTVERDLTQEIVQESMLEMCKVLGKLKKADRFWPWLYGIAVNKVHRHQRDERTQKKLAESKTQRSHAGSSDRQDGLEMLVGQEIKQIVAEAMRSISTRHRAVLVMRCYDSMSYAEVAESMGCSEFGARMLFLRAKRALQRQLSRNGFGKGALLTALAVFGKMTAPSEAAAAKIAVSAGALKVGALAGIVGLATSKTAILSLTATGALVVGSVALNSDTSKQAASQDLGLVSPERVGQPVGNGVKADGEEFWYYFPEGVGGPMMMRVKAGRASEQGYSRVLQNEIANYSYDGGTLSLNSHRTYAEDLTVVRLPTDSPELTDFIDQVEGGRGIEKMQYVSNRERGLLVIATRSQQAAGRRSWSVRHFNVLEEDYFKGDWPAGITPIDNRDAMHRRGWTYFRVSGALRGQVVSGRGRLPFTYAASRQFSPWLLLRLTDGTEVVDTGDGGRVMRAGRLDGIGYRRGSFFKGIGRPWMGLHTADTVRRDAAEQRIPFRTVGREDDHARVELDCRSAKLVYVIDLRSDLVEKIELIGGAGEVGRLEFSYMQEIEDAGSEFAEPRLAPLAIQSDCGLLWLVRLAEGTLGQ